MLNAGWMFVNDDGSFSPYGQETKSYSIPQEEIVVQKRVVKKVRKHRKKKVVKKVVRDSYIEPIMGEKTIYLTFDDGPLSGTENVIDVLTQDSIPATMFMIGKHIESSDYRQDLFLNAIYDPNIFVANHTQNHANGRYRHFYSSVNRVVNDLNQMEDKLISYDTSHTFKCCRLAGRNVFRLDEVNSNDPAIKRRVEYDAYNALRDEGFNIFGWDYQWSYNPKNGKVRQSPRKLVNMIEKIYKRGRTKKAGKFVLLMHDFSFKSKFGGKRQLRQLIALLQDKGWNFETLETY